MSSDYISNRAVVQLSDGENPFVVLFAEICCSNVFPQNPKFSPIFFGRTTEALEKIISIAAEFEGGNIKGSKGKPASPEYDLLKWKQAFKAVHRRLNEPVNIPVVARFATDKNMPARIEFIKAVFQQFGVTTQFVDHAFDDLKSLRVDLTSDGALEALDQLINRSKCILGNEHSQHNKFIYTSDVFKWGYFYESSNEVLLPKSTLPKNDFSVLRVWLLDCYGDQGYMHEERCVIQDEVIVSSDPVKWICANASSGRQTVDKLTDVIYELGKYRKEVLQLPLLTADLVKMTGVPFSEEAYMSLDEYFRKNLIEIGCEQKEIEIPDDKKDLALNCLRLGLKIKISSQKTEKSARQETQLEMTL